MFWRKAKPQVNIAPTPLGDLVRRVGVERRQHLRVLLPQATCAILPQASFEGAPLNMHDISVGGCCLLDPSEILGPNVGNDLQLGLLWHDGYFKVHARIVARVDHKRHIQFLDLAADRADLIRSGIVSGALAQAVMQNAQFPDDGPVLEAREVWSSLNGDSVILEDHFHRLARVMLQETEIALYRDAWPMKDGAKPISRLEMDHLLLFLCNIPLPSKPLQELTAQVCVVSQGRGP